METTKISDTKAEFTKVIPEQVTKVQFERSFLEKQLKDIQASKDAFDALRDVEIAEVEGYLAEMDKLEIVSKEVKPLLEEEKIV